MIITVNGNVHDVKIQKNFSPKYTRALKFETLMSGKTYVSDRTAQADKYDTTFTVIGNIADINALAQDLQSEAGQLTIDSEGEYIFGPAIDYSSEFLCNFGGVQKYPIRDLLTSTLSLSVRPVEAVILDQSIPSVLPDLFIQWPVNVQFANRVNTFDSINVGDYGRTILISTENIISETADIKLRLCTDEFASLQAYVTNIRGSSFLLNTNIELFLGSTSENVKVRKFDFKPNGLRFWDVTMRLVNNV